MVKLKKAKAEKRKSLIDFDAPSNAALFMEELRVLSSAAIGVCCVRTNELHRAAAAIFEFAVSKGDTAFNVWSVVEGWKTLNTSEDSTTPDITTLFSPDIDGLSPGIANAPAEREQEFIFDLYPKNVQADKNTKTLEKAMAALIKRIEDKEDSELGSEHSVNVMFAPDHSWAAPEFIEYIRMFVAKAMSVDARLIFIVNEDAEIPPRLNEDMRIVDFLPPNAAELFESAKDTIQALDMGEDVEPPEVSDEDIERIVMNGLGMSDNEFTSAVSIGLVRQDEAIKDGDPVDIDKVIGGITETKQQMIKRNPILEMLKSVPIEEVGGMDLLKTYLYKQERAFEPGARDFGVDVPRGILAAGPPGTGKSLVAKACSSIFGIAGISLDIGKVFGGLVGQSESQMRQALKIIDAMAPVVLLLDEIDKGFANTSGGGDSGTTARVFGTFLTWMQERSTEKPVFVVMTANNVAGLPPELLRKGRLDQLFAVSFANPKERLEIARIHLRKRKWADERIADEDLKGLVENSPKFSGAEIEDIVKTVLLDAYDAGLKEPTGDMFTRTTQRTRPLSKTYADRVAAMDAWAKENATPASSEYNNVLNKIPGTSDSKPLIKHKPKKVIRPGRGSARN